MKRSIVLLWVVVAIQVAVADDAPAELDASDVGAKVHTFLLSAARAEYPNADVRVSVNPLDSRLRFPVCDKLLLTPHGQSSYGRMSVTLRCDAPRTWAASVTAVVEVWRPVVVALHGLPRGSTINADDITLEPRDLADVRDQFIDAPERAIGWTTRRPIGPGTVLSARTLVAPITVSKGDQVNIHSGQGMVVVTMHGTALADGMSGEQIAVRNLQSQRIIKAWVVAPGLVSAGPRHP
jgi:flagella basal body P-ring formation protein FlgA